MLCVRKVKTGSKATAVQVVLHKGHRAKIVKHIGSARTNEELDVLLMYAQQYISEQTKQELLFPEKRSQILIVNRSGCIGTTHHFARDFLLACAKECGLNKINPLLIDLALMRIIEPASKQRTLWLIKQYFSISYSQRSYRKISDFIREKTTIEQIAFSCAKEVFGERYYLVLYDVTTLYFETHREDDLRIHGFSKDDKSKQPQIVVGLLVNSSGFPLAHEIFPGNTFEGKTMLPVFEKFIKAHNVSFPIVVADAAMLSEKNIEELKQKNILYIVGARLANKDMKFIQRVSNILQQQDGKIIRLPSKHGDMVCSFSSARLRKQVRDMNQQLKKAKDLIKKNLYGNRAKFVKRIGKDSVKINEELIIKTELLLGIKGYCTNIPENVFTNDEIIVRYHDLWRVEQVFRMSKSDLAARPVFHYKVDSIRSHLLICFVALIIAKYLEIITGLSIREIRDLIWNVTEAHIQDSITKETFIFRSPTYQILQSPLGTFIKKWRLPH
jgi:transposase